MSKPCAVHLWTKYALAYVLVMAIPFTVFSVMVNRYLTNEMTASIQSELTNTLSAARQSFDQKINQMVSISLQISQLNDFRGSNLSSYSYASRRGVQQTVKLYRTAHDKIVETVANGGRVLFIGTKRQAQEAVAAEAGRAGQFHVTNRWMGGTLTNFVTIQKSIERLKKLEAMFADGSVNRYQKKEILSFQRELDKLNLTLGGIKDMDSLPQLVFIIDPHREEIAVKECRKLGIPIVAVTDTNCDPDVIDYIIPGNDDAIRAIKLFVTAMAEACLEGEAMRKDSKNKDAEEELKKAAAAEAKAEEAPAAEAAAE